MNQVRNFSIIAHIDHGKSTLADRMLEQTDTVEDRKMQAQMLDSMELERERGITIKMQPVRMAYESGGETYTLNLIDTPGHIDFSYEVSRALKAVEGSLLLVDATQGVQAQTFTTLSMAQEQGLVIIPVVTKIDSPLAKVDDVKLEIAEMLDCDIDEIMAVSGKTGEGVHELLETIVSRIPPPKAEFPETQSSRALIFDFEYDNHRGIIIYARVFDGSVQAGQELVLAAAKEKFQVLEVGIFAPEERPVKVLESGEIGYIVTGIKEPGIASVGDTVTLFKDPLPSLAGYQEPRPVVWASIYPESQDDFTELKSALSRLRLSDASFTYEEESSGALGRGFRCGFLGMLHLEIITERLRREFGLELIITTPSITYYVKARDGKEVVVYAPHLFPNDGLVDEIREPWVSVQIIVPNEYIGNITQLMYEHEALVTGTHSFGMDRSEILADMPLRELMRGFFDRLKSVSSGFASVSYEITGLRSADVVRMDVLVAEEAIPAFSRVVSRRRVQEEAERAVERLHEILPRQMFVVKIQAKALGRILSSKTLKAFRKDVTAKLYGGDITRKMKLREKQKKGKKKMRSRGSVDIPHEVFLKMMRGDNS